jgi:asparagine synthase (glutamine-hydrolysing)
LLSGEGGDEAFAGYPKYRNLLLIERLKSLLGPAKGLLSAGLKGIQAITGRDTRHYQCCVESPVAEYYYGVSGSPATPFNREKSSLYNEQFAAAVRGNVAHEPTRQIFNQLNGESLLQKMLYVDCKSWLPDDLLVKADKMTMATSVELRVPLLDQNVIEFAASLPTSFKVNGKSCKHILKLALGDAVPAAILNRKKAGFPIPYDSWLRTEMRDFVNDTLLSPNASLNDYFQRPKIESLVHRQQEKSGGQHALDCSQEVFSLVILELWHKEFEV